MHERDSRRWEVRQKVVPTLAQPFSLLIFAAATNEYYRMYIEAHHDDGTTTSSMRSSPILDKECPQSLECSRLRNQHQCFKLTSFPPSTLYGLREFTLASTPPLLEECERILGSFPSPRIPCDLPRCTRRG
jgi:hypothetical protein